MSRRFTSIIIPTITALIALFTVNTAVAHAAADQYVALGDSYSSGVGADASKDPYGFNHGNIHPETYEPASLENGCLRNNNAYPHAVAAATELNLAFVACGGATIETLIAGDKGEPSQLDALSVDTELVTMTIGGNDAGFFDIVMCIVTELDCTDNHQTIRDARTFIQNELPARYDDLFAQIYDRAPNARVLLLGYGMALPNRPEQDPWASEAERHTATSVVTQLNNAARNAALRNCAEFVDMHAPGSAYNTPEASMGNMTAGSLTWSIRLEEPIGVSSSVHPTKDGQREMGRLAVAQLA